MPSFRNKRRVPHTPAQMFDLVADVERYPAFLPLCEALRVRRRAASGEGVETLVADMTVGYRAIRETFTSRVTLDRPRMRILVEYVDGPFRHLENRWAFHHLDNGGCEVDFFISYEFKSMALGLVMGAVFERAFHKFAEAFEERARDVYGRGGSVAARA
ncbi:MULTISPECIES: type II toxin-antitoxin system RatA family toxin [Chelatococcus]|uniref:Coenzyme Q-binding protein COQ10 n=1 Tax=Chelatococcus caeni TaxID=1348468 RepID=A0A840BS19_9HYPH|nr:MULTISPECIES: type II toxin-antitoxin system RatA family toxin [Chelatococcus]ALA18948.1 cyclase [Chelatococcus sp. CO-6]MBB4016185.1 coenzyme Q-binding protein COQ10 [Chelatococcus caeni]